MLVPFKSLPKNSRIWIFPSSEEIDFKKKGKNKERPLNSFQIGHHIIKIFGKF